MSGTTYNFRFQVFENLTKASAGIARGFDTIRNRADSVRRSLNVIPNSINDIEREINQLRTAQRSSFDVREIQRYGREIRQRESELQRLNRAANGSRSRIGGIGSSASRMYGAVAGGLAAIGIGQFGGEVVQTLAEFEKYEAVMTNTFGSASVAQTVMRDITEFAAKTPFAVNELTGAYVKLANRGFAPNVEQMTKLGDLASSQGKDFDQLAEALLDAETGEFERLKEFGIRAAKEGENVKLAFKGMEKTVKLDDIRNALIEMGDMEGVKGGMDAISKTTGGMLSNMGDQWTQLKLTIGRTFAPVLNEYLPKITTGIEKVGIFFENNQKPIFAWLKILGKVAVAITAIVVVSRTLMLIQAGVVAVTTAYKAYRAALLTTNAAMAIFNVIAAMNPIGLITIAVFAAIGALYLLVTNFDVVKDYLGSLAAWMWDNHPFKWMVDLIDRVFPGFKSSLSETWEWVKSLFKKAWNWLYDTLIKPITDWFGGAFDGLSFNMDTTMPDSDGSGGSGSFYESLQKTIGGSGGGSSKKGGSKANGVGVNSEIKKIESRSPKNNYITINKLVESLNLSSTTITEGTVKIKDEISKVLIQAVNETNYAH